LAYGKVILLGEHAVVHGHPAVAGAIDLDIRARARVTAGPHTTLAVTGTWGVSASSADETQLGRALGRLVASVAPGRAFAIDAVTTLPAGAGLGSSAALSVATARAIADAVGRVMNADELEAAANAAEAEFHDNPSGVDVALAARGGLGVFRRGRGLRPIHAKPELLAVGLSGEPRSTGTMVARIGQQLRDEPDRVRPLLQHLGDAATEGVVALTANDHEEIGHLFDRAQRALYELGLSTDRIDQLVSVARQSGALGAKLTGAGGGGAVIAMPAEQTVDSAERIADAWAAVGFTAFVTRVGVVRS